MEQNDAHALPLDADFGTKVSQRALGALWGACMTNLPAQIDEVDVVGVFFVIGNSSMQDMMRLLGVGGIDDAEACRDAADMGVNRHKWQTIGEHQGAGGGFGANAGDADEPLECIIGRHLGEVVDRVAPGGVVKIL
ncbi:MAG: hypothetical protein RI985_2010 [Chloroflexota bacterium]